ncbi:DUF402 domain-containing protein [Streptomyces sp. TLI_171]|uniref:DUF402 domain-containing protein n=1 Tax=Streptomyces sp. TLI_171 TaxID=1938859 RepID=UPI000C469DCE|nr:DUF402 domain-containing protein [Streptomyces sp. TLI_171]RKE23357.1 hypothetical protein BX266_6822 [Streptomyces sp. TLI_171]
MVDTEVRFVVRKFDGALHWHHTMRHLGEDAHGVWLGAPIGTVYGKGDRPAVYTTREPRVMLVPRNAWWTALFQGPPAHLDVYCDVTTASSWPTPQEVTMVDLDLDVCRARNDGSVQVLDHDEFAEHRTRYAYPPHVLAHADHAARWLTTALRDSAEPFATHYRSWPARVG